MGTEAACSHVTLSGLMTSADSDAHAYSANAPLHAPKTLSPDLKRNVAAHRFNLAGHITAQADVPWFAQAGLYANEVRPASVVTVKGLTEAARTFIKTSWSPRRGFFHLFTLKNIG